MVEGSEHELTLERASADTPRRPRALWGAVAAIVVLAGTLAVVAAGGGGDDDPPTLPVGLGAVAGGAERTAAGDMAMAAWMTFVAGDALPGLGGEAAAYELVGAADRERVAALASALGLDGEPEAGPDGAWRVETDDAVLEVDGRTMGGAWWFSTSVPGWSEHDDGSSSGGGSAGCEPGPATDCGVAGDGSVAAEECIVTDDPDGTTTERCVAEPVPAVDLPSEDEARRAALDLLAGTGFDVDGATVTVDGPYDAWYVTVEPRLDGVTAAGWSSSVGVGPDGVILHASGTLADPQRLGDYPLIDTRAAIDRLNAVVVGAEPIEPMPLPAPDTTLLEPDAPGAARCAPDAPDCDDTRITTQPCDVQSPDREGCDEPVPPTTSIACKVQPDGREICEVPGTAPFDRGECVTTAEGDDPSATTMPPAGCVEPPPPVEPVPDPEPVEVVLTGAERVLLRMPAIDGSDGAYLVPGYRLTSDDGQVFEVPAVADELLSSPGPETTEVTAAPVPPEPQATECDHAIVSGSGTSITVPWDGCDGVQPSDPELVHLDEGATPEVGVPYYVDVYVECGAFELGGETWVLEGGPDELAGWSTPHEGGRFTLDAPDHGTFVGDAFGTKTASFATGIPGNGCTPVPRP